MSEQRTIHYFDHHTFGRTPADPANPFVVSLCEGVRVTERDTKPDEHGRIRAEATVSDEHAPNVCRRCVADAQDHRARGDYQGIQPALVAP